MPTVIDELIVKLNLDQSGFKKGQAQTSADLKRVRDEAAIFAKGMQAEGAKAAELFSSIKVQALGLIGVLLGGKGVETFIKDTTTSLAALGREARNAGMSVQDLSAFAMAIERNGGNAEAAKNSLIGFAAAMEKTRTQGGGEALRWLPLIGADMNEPTMNILMKFMKFAEEHRNTPNGIQLTNMVGQGIGLDQGLINSLNQIGTVANLRAELEKSKLLGVPSQEMVDHMTDLQKAMISLRQSVDYLSTSIVSRFAPILTKDANDLTTAVTNPTAENIGQVLWDAFELTSPLALLNEKYGWTGTAEEYLNRHSWIGGTAPHAADTSMSPQKRALLDTLAAGESRGYGDHSPLSSAHGRYQFINSTDAEISAETGIHGNSPVDQDRKAWYLAAKTYARYTFGRDLEADLASGLHDADIVAALRGQWPSLPGGSQQNTTMAQFRQRLHRNQLDYVVKSWLPGGSAPDPSLAPHRLAGPRVSAVPAANNDNSTDVTINTLNVHTAATDPKGIAAGINQALSDAIAVQANRGVQ